MNTIAIALKALVTKRDAAQEQVNGLNLAIKALGGSTVAKTVAAGTAAPRTRKPRGPGAPVGPELQAKLDAIKADTSLMPIQKAQASRKARFEASKAVVTEAPGKTNTKRPEGAVLGEAAAG
jgi:hypothetical protein